MCVRSDAYGCRYDDKVLNYILAFEGWSEKSLPGDLGEDKEGENGGD